MRCPRLVSALIALFCIASLAVAAQPKGIVRGIYCRPGAALDSRVWHGYGKGYVVDDTDAHSGQVSIRCSNATDVDAHGAWQTIEFNQREPRPIVVAGWAKLDGVAGGVNYKCSVYLDLRLQNGKSWPMKIAAFDPTKEGWQYAERVYTPPSPIRSARVHVFLREKAGAAWFDDLYVGEIIDAKGTRSKNLLQAPGFETDERRANRHRTEFFSQLDALGCNALHFYKGVTWEHVMAPGALPKPAADDPLPGFVRAAHERGYKVWLTVGLGWPAIKNAQSPEHPLHMCVNGRWGEAYGRAVAHFAQFGFDGIGAVPDEWTWTNGRVKAAYSKHKDPEVAAAYKNMTTYCDCGMCKQKFHARYGAGLPDMHAMWKGDGRTWARFVDFRYASTAEWIQRTVAAAKQVNPAIVVDTMIGVHPICMDDRIGAGAAWDVIGARTQLDCLQTDPYIFLHNYKGDSTHWYATETALHLASANWRRRAGVTLEASRLLETYREKDPAEVYGAALSCLAHGAREFFWWHMNHVTGKTAFVDSAKASKRVAAAYQVMREMEPYVADAAAPGEVLVLYSRRSEDTWHLWSKRGEAPVPHEGKMDPRRGFNAHKNALYWLLRRGYPFRMTFLEDPDPAKLAAAKAVVAPFPLALTEAEARAIERLAQQGKTVILMSHLSPVDEWGQPLALPRLARLLGGQTPAADTREPVVKRVGKGRVAFIPGDSAIELFQPVEAVKDKKRRVPLAAFNTARTAALERLLTSALGRPGSVFAAQPEGDVEATVLDGRAGRVILAINWDVAKPIDVQLRPDATAGRSRATGLRIDASAEVSEVDVTVAGGGLRLNLKPQDAVLLRLR